MKLCSYLRGVWTELALQGISLVSLNFMFWIEFGGLLCHPSHKAPDITMATIVHCCHVRPFWVHCYVLNGCFSLRYLENSAFTLLLPSDFQFAES